MDYTNYSKEQLIERIKDLEMLNRELIQEKEEEVTLEFSWSGNLGHWYWNTQSNEVTFNPLKVKTLGYNLDELPDKINYQFFTDKLHPDDYQITMDAMLDHLQGRAEVYEVEYRIQAKNGKYKWFYDRGKVTQFDEDGKPVFLAGIVFDISERKELQQELEHKNRVLSKLSSEDSLTQISNRRTLMMHLSERISEADRIRTPLSIAMFDIDDFKQINDVKGHVTGDKVLNQIANIMTGTIRSSDLVGRYGGEEFVVIFQQTNLSDAKKIAERIRKNIEQASFSDNLKVTISGGVSQYQGQSIEDFLDATDQNLYMAKDKGKNRVIAH